MFFLLIIPCLPFEFTLLLSLDDAKNSWFFVCGIVAVNVFHLITSVFFYFKCLIYSNWGTIKDTPVPTYLLDKYTPIHAYIRVCIVVVFSLNILSTNSI